MTPQYKKARQKGWTNNSHKSAIQNLDKQITYKKTKKKKVKLIYTIQGDYKDDKKITLDRKYNSEKGAMQFVEQFERGGTGWGKLFNLIDWKIVEI